MSATNSTANYELPIFLATDKPAWLTDWNGAMNAIDTAIHAAQATADGAQTTASAATADISTINTSLTTITGNITSLTTSVNSNTGAINTINSLIGNGEPTTTDKTLIGAINEIYGMITGGGGNEIEAQNVSYDNTTSGLTADDVQSAIDEVYAAIPVGPSGAPISFGNASSVTATSTFTIDEQLIKTASANNGTYAKLYGGFTIDLSNQTTLTGDVVVASLPVSFGTPSQAYDILMGYSLLRFQYNSASYTTGVFTKLHVNTNGTVDITVDFTPYASGYTYNSLIVSLPPCIYQLEDWGD